MAAETAAHLADAVLFLHAGFVLFVVGGQAMVLLGWYRGWRWTRGFTWRVLHLCADVVRVLVADSFRRIAVPNELYR